MPFKLTKEEKVRRATLVSQLNEKAAGISTAVEQYNEAVVEMRDAVDKAVAEYNAALTEAREFTDEIAAQADSDFEEKSEKWQESDRGQEAGEWRDCWQGVELDDVEVTMPEELDVAEFDHADDLESLPE